LTRGPVGGRVPGWTTRPAGLATTSSGRPRSGRPGAGPRPPARRRRGLGRRPAGRSPPRAGGPWAAAGRPRHPRPSSAQRAAWAREVAGQVATTSSSRRPADPWAATASPGRGGLGGRVGAGPRAPRPGRPAGSSAVAVGRGWSWSRSARPRRMASSSPPTTMQESARLNTGQMPTLMKSTTSPRSRPSPAAAGRSGCRAPRRGSGRARPAWTAAGAARGVDDPADDHDGHQPRRTAGRRSAARTPRRSWSV
jgi:hypothetical protein